jgi:hypothetical protein
MVNADSRYQIAAKENDRRFRVLWSWSPKSLFMTHDGMVVVEKLRLHFGLIVNTKCNDDCYFARIIDVNIKACIAIILESSDIELETNVDIRNGITVGGFGYSLAR